MRLQQADIILLDFFQETLNKLYGPSSEWPLEEAVLKKTLLLSICLSLPTLALAHKGPRGHKHQRHKRSAHQKSVKVVAPGVHIVMGSRPWSPSYVPPARAGFSWVAGRYVGVRWVPGYWRPVGPPPRTQVVYVVGHWEGNPMSTAIGEMSLVTAITGKMAITMMKEPG